MDSGGKGAAALTITADMLKDLAPTVSASACSGRYYNHGNHGWCIFDSSYLV